MKKITAGNLAHWNGTERTLNEFIDWLQQKPRLDAKHSKLLNDLIMAHNNFLSQMSDDDTEL